MNTHRIHVFDGADNDGVILFVAHHLHLIFLPSKDRLFEQNFGGQAGLKTALGNLDKLFHVVGNTAARSAKREGGADNNWKIEFFFGNFTGFVEVMNLVAPQGFDTRLGHHLFKEIALLATHNGIVRGTNHFDAMLFEDALLHQFHGGIEGGLASKGWKNGIGLFFDNNFFNRLGRDGLDVGAVGGGRIGHDGRRIRVDQRDGIPLFSKRFTRLRAGIIEFAGLSDHDGAGTND